VMLSSSQFDADAQVAKNLGAREFLTKPVDFRDLIKLASGIYDRWLAEHTATACSQIPTNQSFQLSTEFLSPTTSWETSFGHCPLWVALNASQTGSKAACLENCRWQTHCHGLFELPIVA